MPTVEYETANYLAVFYPEVGGKLASLVHKPSNRELLFNNPVFQPGNLGRLNAWTSGGGECTYTTYEYHCLGRNVLIWRLCR